MPGKGIYIVEVATEYGQRAYRATGSQTSGSIGVAIDGEDVAVEHDLKSAKLALINDFSFQVGDSLRIAAFRDGYYARSVMLEITTSEWIAFLFDISRVETDGISDVYVDLAEATDIPDLIDLATGEVQIEYTEESRSLQAGDIITVDADTAGYLRKVGSVTETDETVVLETEQAFMNELFVNKAFKLKTTLIEPPPGLKSTGSMKEISKALTDDQGYIHPVKIIYFNSGGEAMEMSAFHLKGTSDETGIHILDVLWDLSGTDLYGEAGDNVHFYVSEGEIEFKTDAVFEFDFTYEGKFTEDMKAKKGDLNLFEFYLEATACVHTEVALDMTKARDKNGDPKRLFKIASARAQFIVPPGIPVWIDFNVDMYRAFILQADASLHADWGFEINDTLKVGGRYTRATKTLTPISEFSHHDTIFPLNLKGEINVSARFELYPRVDMKLYSIFGPYAEVVPYVQGHYNAAAQVQVTPSGTKPFLAYNAGIDLGLDLRVGTELEVLGFKKVFGPKIVALPNTPFPLWRSPYQIELISDLPDQVGTGSSLSLHYKVTDNIGLPVMAPVYVEGDGTFSKYIAFTNPLGELAVDWTIGESEGTYGVTATIFNADKSIADQDSKSITALNYTPPVAAFNASQTSITEGEQVIFTDQSTNTPNSWSWDFGDGGTSSIQHPKHTYSNAGTYSVSLTASNSYGSNIKTQTITVSEGGSGGETGTVTDYDGNTYNTIKIGSQWWMAENLKTTKYSNGTAIPLVESTSAWDNLGYSDKAYCWYDNSTSNRDNYGGLYTWAAAMNGAGSSSANPSNVQGVCPAGWHLPSDAEWKQLEMQLGMSQSEADDTGWRGTDEGSKLKETGTTHWNSPNTGATNSSGFTALPGGFRSNSGSFYNVGSHAYFWTATENSGSNAWNRNLNYDNPEVNRNNNNKNNGFSARCVRDWF